MESILGLQNQKKEKSKYFEDEKKVETLKTKLIKIKTNIFKGEMWAVMKPSQEKGRLLIYIPAS